MAASKSQKKTPDPTERAINSTLTLAARDGWDNFTFEDIARHAKISLPDLQRQFEDKHDILSAYGRRVDYRVLETISGDIAGNHRDRLFDILMERFDVLNEDRAALISILESYRCDPQHAAITLPHLGRSMSRMLEAAGIDTDGLRGGAHILALTILYLATLRIWIDDDSEDMSKTMAALDKNLGRAEQLAGMMGFAD